MSAFGECKGYMNKPCPNCGRYRLEYYEKGYEICEKCRWCEQLNTYVDDEEDFLDHCSECNCYESCETALMNKRIGMPDIAGGCFVPKDGEHE